MVFKIVLYIKVLVFFSHGHDAYSFYGDYDDGRYYGDHGYTKDNGHYEWGYVDMPTSDKFPANQYWSPPQQPYEQYQSTGEIKQQDSQYERNPPEENWSYKDWAQNTYRIIPSIQTSQEIRAYLPPAQHAEIPQEVLTPNIPYRIIPSIQTSQESQAYLPPAQHAEIQQEVPPPSIPLEPEPKLGDIPNGESGPTFMNVENPDTSLINMSTTEILQTLATTTEPSLVDRNSPDYRPCDPYNPPIPDFSAPNRRLSETKCYENIWNIKYTEELSIRQTDCRKQMNIFAVLVGVDAKLGEFPHMAAIGWKASKGTWIFKCGGSLISRKFVLTAGHCIKGSRRDITIADLVPKIVRFGDLDIRDKFYDSRNNRNISRIIAHPLYRAPNRYNDIALFELASEVTLSQYISPACLWTKPDVSSLGAKAKVTGWGIIDTATLKTSPILQVAQVDLIPSDTCQNLLGNMCNRLWCGVQDTQICAGTLAGGADTCQGDSGGPLQVKIALPAKAVGSLYYVVGVTSIGFKCGRANSPGIYSRVSSYLDWIESVVWPEN